MRGMLVERLINNRIRITPVKVLRVWRECNKAQVQLGSKKYYVELSDIRTNDRNKEKLA